MTDETNDAGDLFVPADVVEDDTDVEPEETTEGKLPEAEPEFEAIEDRPGYNPHSMMFKYRVLQGEHSVGGKTYKRHDRIVTDKDLIAHYNATRDPIMVQGVEVPAGDYHFQPYK